LVGPNEGGRPEERKFYAFFGQQWRMS